MENLSTSGEEPWRPVRAPIDTSFVINLFTFTGKIFCNKLGLSPSFLRSEKHRTAVLRL